MKVVLIILSIVAASSSFAADAKDERGKPAGDQPFSAEQIFNALGTDEYSVFPGNQRVVGKSVGGITCIKSKNGNGVFVYECGLDKAESFCHLKAWGGAVVGDARVPNCAN